MAVIHVPGLFQTEEYAHALFSYMNPEFPPPEVELRVAHRMRRKVVIEDPDPMPYETVIHEAALRISVAGRSAMRAQLRRILEMSEAEHVTVRVVPFALDDFAGAGSTMVYLGGGAVPPPGHRGPGRAAWHGLRGLGIATRALPKALRQGESRVAAPPGTVTRSHPPVVPRPVRSSSMAIHAEWKKSSYSGGGEGNDCVEIARVPPLT